MAVWTIAALCLLFYGLGHIAHWPPLELTQLAWRGIGKAAVFKTPLFWAFAPISTLLHTGAIHLALNLWCLAVLGAFVERREGAIATIGLWPLSAYTAMGAQALTDGVGRIGLSAVTYALLGAALLHWREAALSPSRRWTGVAMLGLLLAGGLEWLGVPPLAPEVAHVAHAAGLLTGWLYALALRGRDRAAA